MRWMLARLLLARLLFASLLLAGAAPAQEVLARFPPGTFLENLLVDTDGSVVFTSYFDRSIRRWQTDGTLATVAEIDGHPVSVVRHPPTAVYLVVAHRVPFTQGPDAMRGHAVLHVLDAAGTQVTARPLPPLVFPNGMLILPDQRTLLIVDSAGGVFAFDLRNGLLSVWIADPLLRPVEGQPHPGVNGVKLAADGQAVLLSNSARRALLRVPFQDNAPTGPVALLRDGLPGIDDFWVMPDGTIHAATHAATILTIAPDGAMRSTAVPLAAGNTAVAPSRDGAWLYVLGTGGMLEGGTGDAVLGRVPLR
jgi:hypothetical protein